MSQAYIIPGSLFSLLRNDEICVRRRRKPRIVDRPEGPAFNRISGDVFAYIIIEIRRLRENERRRRPHTHTRRNERWEVNQEVRVSGRRARVSQVSHKNITGTVSHSSAECLTIPILRRRYVIIVTFTAPQYPFPLVIKPHKILHWKLIQCRTFRFTLCMCPHSTIATML